MRALTVIPGKAGSARLDDVPEPPLDDGPILVQTLLIGVCGTDLDIVRGDYSVNANRRHYEAGALALARADLAWLERLITRRVPLERWADALQRQPNDVKAVIEVTS